MLHTVRHTTKELATAATRLDLRDGRSEDRIRLVISCMVSGWTYPATHGSRSKTEPRVASCTFAKPAAITSNILSSKAVRHRSHR